MTFTSRIEVDLSAIEKNVGVVRSVVGPNVGLCAVMKADGYGLGAARVAKRLGPAGVNMFAVYTTEQACSLLDANLPGNAPVLVLTPLRDIERNDPIYRALQTERVHVTVHDIEHFESLLTIASSLGVRLHVHMEVDTGMSRGGMSPAEASKLLERMATQPRVRLAGVFTHCASADCDPDQTRRQADMFDRFLEQNRELLPDDCIIHQANTFGTFRAPRVHRSMVRVGLALLGYAGEEFADPANFQHAAAAEQLTPAVRWISKLVQTKWIEPGTTVGYGGTWKAKRRTRLGLIPVGYADGYPLACSNRARVGVELAGGVRAYVPIVGRVSMDQVTVDLTDLPEVGIGVGSWVELVGNERGAPNHLPVLARHAGTITHELLCRFSQRLPRHYIASEEMRPDTSNDVVFAEKPAQKDANRAVG